ncbi:MAG TPA: DNA adenine methylase [Candidatus Limnocylindrales bacterium]
MTATNLTLPLFPTSRIEASPRLTPFLKWPGGKSQELPAIAAVAPDLAGRLIDPFVGGGSVLLATPTEVPAWANDACPELIALFVAGARRDVEVLGAITGVAGAWDGLGTLGGLYEGLARAFPAGTGADVRGELDAHRVALRAVSDDAGPGAADLFLGRVAGELLAKFGRMRAVQTKLGRDLSRPDLLANIEGSIRSSLYMALRARYNGARLAGRLDSLRLADFFFLREFTYAAMFRFNGKGEFNVPYGGVSYNRKSLRPKADVLFGDATRERLASTTFRSGDFEPFLEAAAVTADDFVFVDPPYDSDFSDYDNRAFGACDQVRLRDVLASLPARVMVVMKDTPAIRELYPPDRWYVLQADKTYLWTIKSRNDRGATHLTITNYEPDGMHASHSGVGRAPDR